MSAPKISLLLSLLLSFLLAAGGTLAQSPGSRTFAVRTADAELTRAVENGAFHRWIAPREEGLASRVGPEVDGDLLVEALLLPAPAEVAERLAGLPVRVPVAAGGDGAAEALALGTTTYEAPHQALALRLPAAQRPHWLVVGWRADVTARVVDWVLRTAAGRQVRGVDEAFDFLLYDNLWTLRTGRWQRNAEGRWDIAPGGRDDLLERRRFYESLVVVERPGLVLRVPEGREDDAELQGVADRLAAAVEEMVLRVPLTLEEPLEMIVEEDYVAMGRHLGRVGSAEVEADRVHVVFDVRDEDAYRYGLARALVRRGSLAGTRAPWLEDGAALWLAQRWFGRSYQGWLPDLAFARVLPTTPELLAEERQQDGSDVLWPPVGAAVVEGLPGKTLTAKLARPPGEITVEGLLRGLRTRPAAEAGSEEGGSTGPAAAEAPFLRGVSLAMPPGLEYAYHAPSMAAKLDVLDTLGVDSVSLMPYAFMRAVDQPELRSRITSPTDETDVGLLHAARRAHQQGFRVLWKPHVYVWGPGWVGEVAMTSEADWRAWWRSYRRYVVHHAVLAAHEGAEMMAVGVELGGTLEREADWRHLIASIRRIYPGRLTYAGNWWGDYDRVPFWDDLDHLGVDAYFPLADGETEDQALVEGVGRMMEQVGDVARREGKGVIFTEVGFAARRHAWASPHEEGGEFSAEDQHRAYRVLLGTLGKPEWLDGVFFWKVYSTPGVIGDGDTRPDFRFLGRPAQKAVEHYFAAPPG